MTFAIDFAHYRDDRPLGATPPDAFWDAMKVEAGRMLAERRQSYPDRVAKGRMSKAEADRELRVARAIAEDWAAAPRSPDFPLASWDEMVHALRREIALRRKFWPDRVATRRMTADEAEHRLVTIETWHDLLWDSHCKEARAARVARDAQRLALPPPLDRAA